jgi:putative PIN family toxin of toxin-antitoxin system
MIIVLDTNVLVSALLSAFGPSARILDLLLTGELQLAYDDRLLAEYRQVLARPKFKFDPMATAELVNYLATTGLWTAARPLATVLPDPHDLPFLEVAAQVGATLVTGNRRHFPVEACEGVTVLTPAEFMTWWLATQA